MQEEPGAVTLSRDKRSLSFLREALDECILNSNKKAVPVFFSRRYQSVIDALYPENRTCPNCGLRFDESGPGGAERYERHLDWHFKQNQRVKDTSRGQSRPWYFASEVSYSGGIRIGKLVRMSAKHGGAFRARMRQTFRALFFHY